MDETMVSSAETNQASHVDQYQKPLRLLDLQHPRQGTFPTSFIPFGCGARCHCWTGHTRLYGSYLVGR